MIECDIFLPAVDSPEAGEEANAQRAEAVETFKREVRERFGGYTHFDHRSEGSWEFAGRTFQESVTVLRVLAPNGDWDVTNGGDGACAAHREMAEMKHRLEEALDEEEILIVVRRVDVVE